MPSSPSGSAAANDRVVRTIKARPSDLIEADRAAMLPLPPVPPQVGWRHRVRLGRDYYVRLDASDYSVDPAVIGQLVDVTADLERVQARAEGRVVADHPRAWARGTTITDPGHTRTAQRLREEFRQPAQLAQPGTWSVTWPTTTAHSAWLPAARWRDER